MTAAFDQDALRHWLADHLVTNIGCNPEDIDFDGSMHDLGVGSRDAVVLSGELSELLGRPVSPVEFWEHSTINALAAFLTGAEPDADAEAMTTGDRGSMDEPIAVIGLGCRFPGEIAGPEAFWQFLCEGRSAVKEVPPDRWSPFDDGSAVVAEALSGTTRWGSFLSDIAGFDAEFFEISPREAAKMDPQQRLLLEVAWEALEHAGVVPGSLRHSQTGVFAGACLGEYGYLASSDLSQVDPWSGTGGALSIIANRVSYFLDLRGPSVAVDTACSSSLVAVHLACQSLRTGDSDLALAAGVNLLLSPAVTRSFDQAQAMSPTGQCHAFDAAADGFVRGEGCGAVVLKRLSDALRDGDRVLAVVRGSAVNQDGRSNGLMAPNPPAQMAVLRRAYANAGVDPREVDYVEAHGIGTLLGDPIEARALGTVLGRGRPQTSPLLIGAVKSNLGNLEAAAGIAGFIKAVLAVHRGRIPANCRFENPNPHIPFDNLRLKVVGKQTDWPSMGRLRRAGVSSFGLGGTNAHVVLEQGPDLEAGSVSVPHPGVTTLVVSGKTPQRIASTAAVLADWMERDGADVGLPDVAHTLNHHRSQYGKFATVCARDRGQAVAGLRALAQGRSAVGVVAPHQRGCRPGTVFVYSGQGSQWPGMGRQLLADEPAFAAAVAELEPVFVEQVGFSLRRVLADGEPVAGIERIHPVLVGVQLALTALWRSYGVQPDAVIGHSMGEVTAAVVAGALSPADGLKVIATRSRLMSRLPGQGAMALLDLDPDVASHHPAIDPILPELRTALGDLRPQAPSIPVLGTTCDHLPAGAVMFDADYWVANLRNPVRFSQIVAAAGADHNTFIEVSPHPLLTHAITDTLATAHHHSIPTLLRDTDETLTFHAHLNATHTADPPTTDHLPGPHRDLPTTPWHHTRHWFANRSAGRNVTGTHPLLGMHIEMPSGAGDVWQADVGTEVIPWLADHQVHGQPVMPAAGFAEIALAAAGEALRLPVEAVGLSRLEVGQMLVLDSRTSVTTQLVRSAGNGIGVEVYSRSVRGSWCRHAVACVDVVQTDGAIAGADSPAEAGTAVSPAEFYAALRRTGAYHGPAFAALSRIVRMPDGSVQTEIVLPDEAAPHREYRIHPVMFDAALQSLAAAMPVESSSAEVTYLPASFETIRVFGDVGTRARCRAELVSVDDDGRDAHGRVALTDEAGTATAVITGVRLRRVLRRNLPLPLAQKVFDTLWVQAPASSGVSPATPAGSWLVLTEDDTKAIAHDFAAGFGSPRRRVISADVCDDTAVVDAVTKTAADSDLPPAGVVVFVGHRPFDGTDADGALARARELVWAISATSRAVVDGWQPKPPRLWIVTRNGLVVDGDEAGDPAVGALKGLIRVLPYEHPDLVTTLVDLDTADDLLARLTTELESSGSDDVIAWRGQRRYVERLSRAALGERGRGPVVRPDGSYIVTGGLDGIGMVVAGWLVDSGAARVVLNGRTGPSAGQRGTLADLETRAEISRAEIAVVEGDIASRGVAERLVAAAEETGRPLRGLVHAAAVIDDDMVASLSRQSLERVWAPTASGALRLHEVTANRPLDWWVGFSSMASLLGSPGQAACASANAWLDGLVAWRRAAGLPATGINWCQWSDVEIAPSLTLNVVDPVTAAEGIEALEAVLAGNLTRVGVARLRLDRAAAALPEIHRRGYFASVVRELDAGDGDRFVDGRDRGVAPVPDWSRMSAEELRGELAIRLRAILAGELQMPASAVDMDRAFPELGLDSMMAMTVLREATKLVGIEVSGTMLWNHPTISLLAAQLAETLASRQESQDGHGSEDTGSDVMSDSTGSVLDALFDSVESAPVGRESGIR